MPSRIPILFAAVWFAAAQPSAKVDDAALRNAGKTGEEWLTYGLTQAETRYSPLRQIDTSNVNRLGLAWSYDLGAGGGSQEATPLVWNGAIFGITNWSMVFAVDARTGQEKWRWDPEVNQDKVFSKLCCGVVNRGLALYQGLVIAGINDGRLQALDAETGKPVWEARVAYPQDQYTITMAPRIAKGKVIIGASGGDRPTRGFFDAYDALTGRRAWRFYTVPGGPSKAPENAAMRKAAATWDGEFWKQGGGGAVWDGMAYDPEADLIYIGTGNAEPWPEQLRYSKGKDNLYVCSILAVRPDSGDLKWYFQMVPGDSWDYDSVQQMILADLTITGRTRKVIMQANKNAFYYVIDRLSGEFISAQPFSMVTWAKGLDEKTGRPFVNEAAHYGLEGIPISPGGGGAHNWSPMAFNPNTGLVYIPTSTANTFTYAAQETFAANPNGGVGGAIGLNSRPKSTRPAPPAIGPAPLEGQGNRGALVAWDPVAQQMRWRMPGGGGIGGGALTTAGNLVFQVVNDGRLLAYSADKGEKVFELQTGLRAGMGPPITYQIDGKQYVALMGGTGRVRPRSVASPEPTAAGAQAADGPARRAAAPAVAPRLLVFALDGRGTLPAEPIR
ncbi:MAG TPA: PQQ-dependent dehydrogenase, methanol/ethanol family [Bryobacteraceae bacterium]|nr:PQQ-dependent dehydrogenase, methanol/ethanol family [Bryobacteraceae bacterium]